MAVEFGDKSFVSNISTFKDCMFIQLSVNTIQISSYELMNVEIKNWRKKRGQRNYVKGYLSKIVCEDYTVKSDWGHFWNNCVPLVRITA